MSYLLAARGQSRDADDGFTLVELMVYMFLLLILGAMVATLVINGMRSQATVTGTINNTGEMQNAASGIEYDVRYASDVKVSPDGSMLRTRTWVGDPDEGAYACRGWFYNGATGELTRSTSNTAVAAATASSAANWTRMVADVTASTAFIYDETTGTVDVRIDGDPDVWGHGTRVYTTVTQRPQGAEGGVTCF